MSPIQTKFNHSLEVSIGQRGSGSQSIEQSVLDETYFCIVNGNIERLSELVVDNKLDLAQVQFQVCAQLCCDPYHHIVLNNVSLGSGLLSPARCGDSRPVGDGAISFRQERRHQFERQSE